MRLVECSVTKDATDPEAISYYGPYVPEFNQTWLRFVDVRPSGDRDNHPVSLLVLGEALREEREGVVVDLLGQRYLARKKEVRSWIE